MKISNRSLAKKYRDRWTQEPGRSLLAQLNVLIHEHWVQESGKAAQAQMTPPVAEQKVSSAFSEKLRFLLVDLPFSDEVPDHKDFRGISLGGIFYNVDFRHFDFSFATLHISFMNCKLEHARFDFADVGVKLGNNLSHASFYKATMRRCSFSRSVAQFCNFDHAKMTRCHFIETDLRHSSFVNATCTSASLSGARIEGCNFQQAILDRSALSGSTADSSTDLRGASLKGCYVTEHRDIYHNLIGAAFDYRTCLFDDNTIPP